MKACMLAYTHYEVDNRVRHYAEALIQKGWQVDAIVLKKHGQKYNNIINGVNLYRIQERIPNEKGKINYLIRLLKFFFHSTFSILEQSFKGKYDIIHVHSIPNFEVFATILSKLLGTKIILDIHDPVPDFFAVKFAKSKNNIFIGALKVIEWISTKYSDYVITVTDYWANVICERSKIPPKKISVIVNFPDTNIFNRDNYPSKIAQNSSFTLLYPGTINKHCGLDIIIKAVRYVKDEFKPFRFDIYGQGSEYDTILRMVTHLQLEDTVFFHDIVPSESVPELMLNADAGIAILAGKDIYAQQALNVKLFEFLAMGLPTIATRTHSTEYYLNDSIVMFSKMNDPKDVAKCIKELINNKQKREFLSANGLNYIKSNNWNNQKNIYLSIIEQLTRSFPLT